MHRKFADLADSLHPSFERLMAMEPVSYCALPKGVPSSGIYCQSGHSGEAPLATFAIRGRELVIYLVPEQRGNDTLMSTLGPHRLGKSCLYFRRLADLDRSVLQELVAGSIAEVRRRWP